VLTTGTGSGKSLAYLVPIVDFVLRRGSGRGIRAIVVYPMNALANSQAVDRVDTGKRHFRSPAGLSTYIPHYSRRICGPFPARVNRSR
jgi:ATP-dependent helicase YprA (DUF1998 family)